MRIRSHIIGSIYNLMSAKLRSFLAILGIVVGTGSVVALITSSLLATEHALAQFKRLGTNLINMTVSQTSGSNAKTTMKTQITLPDMPKIESASDQISEIAPYINMFQPLYTNDNGGSLSQEYVQVLGATSEIARIAKISLVTGRFISVLDGYRLYCDIGSSIASALAKTGIKNPIGKQIQIGSNFFTIIGVLKPWETSMFLPMNLNKGVIIPIEASYLVDTNAQIRSLLVRIKPQSDINAVQAALNKRISELFPGLQANFVNPQQILSVVGKQRSTFVLLLSSIGAISLIVGGIGVMNIMLVSVVERRKEIGLRMAIGAKGRDILQMFFIESIILTLFGGIVGIILGMGVSFALAYFNGWEIKIYLGPPLLGFIVSMAVGLISGIYPSYRASRLDPIDTLQSE